jgi:penicillin G amidase
MKYTIALLLLLIAQINLFAQEQLNLPGLEKPVEIITDQWGVPHIYAQNEHDLFFAQGFYAARDRLFQFEMWRRQATGTVAEILGEREIDRDHGARLFRFRGNMDQEMAHYHPRGKQIITAFVAGVNAWIKQTQQQPDLLPMEFKLLNLKPGLWTPEVVISRHQGLLENAQNELKNAQAILLVGEEKLKALSWFHPKEPDLKLDPKIPVELLQQDILKLYNAFRKPLSFQPDNLIGAVRNPDAKDYQHWAAIDAEEYLQNQSERLSNVGSNNWIVSGSRTQSGFPMLANDPHRAISAPSLRYMSHLVAPGWNVIGGGEPVIPGISIGHNEYGAWGLTIFATDAEDLYVYETNPNNPNLYKVGTEWRKMTIIKDTIKVKGREPVVVELKYTHHGPVVHEDSKLKTACAVRCAWLEVGGAPYLASLRMGQAKNWNEFRQACGYSHIPAENMIWADRAGNIGWQAVGITPIRRKHSGLLPVPGDGRFEWEGYLPILERPSVYNPAKGFWNTSNEDGTPKNYNKWESIGFVWADPYRSDRSEEVLSSGKQHTLADFMALQTDYLSIPARNLVPLLRNLVSTDTSAEWARKALLQWDYQLEKNSIAATLYDAWERQMKAQFEQMLMPEKARSLITLQPYRMVEFLLLPDGKFGANPTLERNNFMLKALSAAMRSLETRFLGMPRSQWQYGQALYKHVLIRHPLSNAVNPELRQKLDHGPLPRGGSGMTVGATGGTYNQLSGASFRFMVDTGNWDYCLGTNTPGQSGNPEHPHYRNLFEMWANDQYFPLFYSRKKIESVKYATMSLKP